MHPVLPYPCCPLEPAEIGPLCPAGESPEELWAEIVSSQLLPQGQGDHKNSMAPFFCVPRPGCAENQWAIAVWGRPDGLQMDSDRSPLLR